MTYKFKPAKREQTPVLIGLAGPSGSGKTYSALRLATGLAGKDAKIFMIDTEARRGLHYADKFDFQHLDLGPPFRPDNCRHAIEAAEAAGAEVIIFDSMSHEYAGEGGIMEWADDIGEQMNKPDAVQKWKTPKTSHKRFVSRILQCRAHIIFCFRAEEKMLIERQRDEQTGRIKTVVTAPQDRPLKDRWSAITEKNFMYEMTAAFLLLDDTPGAPIHAFKLQEQHKPFFKKGQPLDENAGQQMAAWAGTGAPPEKPPANQAEKPEADAPGLYDRANEAAKKGTENLQGFWDGLERDEKIELKPQMEGLKRTAANADFDLGL